MTDLCTAQYLWLGGFCGTTVILTLFITFFSVYTYMNEHPIFDDNTIKFCKIEKSSKIYRENLRFKNVYKNDVLGTFTSRSHRSSNKCTRTFWNLCDIQRVSEQNSSNWNQTNILLFTLLITYACTPSH